MIGDTLGRGGVRESAGPERVAVILAGLLDDTQPPPAGWLAPAEHAAWCEALARYTQALDQARRADGSA